MLRKIRQGPPGPWTPGTRGRTPLDSPAPCPSGIGCGSIEPAASSGASLPSHGLKIEGVTPVELEEENKTDLPTTPKWQIGLFLWQKVARRETERSASSAKRAAATHWGIPKGAALGAPLVTFPASGKSPGVEGRSARTGEQAPSLTTCSRGAAPLASYSGRPGRGAERPHWGADTKSDDLLPRGSAPRKKSRESPLGINKKSCPPASTPRR